MEAIKKTNKQLDLSISTDFSVINNKIEKFNIHNLNDPLFLNEYIEIFSIDKIFSKNKLDGAFTKNSNLNRSVSKFEEKPFEPKYVDLCRLHFLALSRKCLNIMEFGSGFSTTILADAMRILNYYFLDYAKKNIRVENPFHVYSIEEEQRFLEVTKKRMSKKLLNFVTLSRSTIEIISHDNRIATLYSKLPNISPDLIYIDGPSQFGSSKEINGFSFNSMARMPMTADVLRFEFFLEPGTLILVDGRTANARFLKSYLKRNWVYYFDKLGDVHYFELQEDPLGRFNQLKIDFCLGGKWLLPSAQD